MSRVRTAFKDLRVGDVFPTVEGGSVTVIAIVDNADVTVKHNDLHGHIQVTQLGHLNNGYLKNPYHPSVQGIGYLGVGPYLPSITGKLTVEYEIWRTMLKRCYDANFHINNPTYIGCTVHSDWLNFQTFAQWYCKNPYCRQGYDLDKDILYYGNKIYGPGTCVLVPHEVNILFRDSSKKSVNRDLPTGVELIGSKYRARLGSKHIGTYMTLHEAHLAYLTHKRTGYLFIAEKYKHAIDVRVYHAILNLASNVLNCAGLEFAPSKGDD